MYDTILIDYFGVIESSLYDSWLGRHGYERSGIFSDASNLVDAGKISMQQFFDELGSISGIPAKEIDKDFRAHEVLNIKILRLLKDLKPKYKIVLVSNASGNYLRDILQRYNLEPIFTDIVISGEIGIIKPNPEIFEYALNRVESKVESTLFIDDHLSNVKAAQNIGITGIQYTDFESLCVEFNRLGIK